MIRCEVCGEREKFRVFMNLDMCVICYQTNLRESRKIKTTGKIIKANSSDTSKPYKGTIGNGNLS